ncbi:MAG: hypothetical protein SOW48_04935 [Peptoniphilaceae bacterium]|nr:hypothetical protein [Peptoniphilaceae bacterium]MDY3075974.1 hypothetical protein [Peptoniphilaceae bacterium]
MTNRPHKKAEDLITPPKPMKRRRKRKKKYTWASFWAIAKYPIYLLIAIATTGYLVGGSWIWYILLTK